MTTELSPIGKVRALEEVLLTMPQTDLMTTHHLSGGMYARTIHIPAGCVLTGATHKFDHINVVCGDISVTLEDGSVKRITGFQVLPTKAGAKRAGVAHTDTCWTTISATDLTDIEEIEDSIVVEADQLQTRRQLLTHNESMKLEA